MHTRFKSFQRYRFSRGIRLVLRTMHTNVNNPSIVALTSHTKLGRAYDAWDTMHQGRHTIRWDDRSKKEMDAIIWMESGRIPKMGAELILALNTIPWRSRAVCIVISTPGDSDSITVALRNLNCNATEELRSRGWTKRVEICP